MTYTSLYDLYINIYNFGMVIWLCQATQFPDGKKENYIY